MLGTRALLLIPAFLLLVLPLTADAQGRGSEKNRNGNGPAFCRNGQGHPVHGREWCRQRGWDNGIYRSADGRRALPRDRRIGTMTRTTGRVPPMPMSIATGSVRGTSRAMPTANATAVAAARAGFPGRSDSR